jgi:hypothetical protein
MRLLEPASLATCLAAVWVCTATDLPAAREGRPSGAPTRSVERVRAIPGPRDVLRAAEGDANYAYGPSRTRLRGLRATAAPSANIVLVPRGSLAQNAAAMSAFAAAADVWAHTIVSPVPIRVEAWFHDMGDPFILGSAGPTNICAIGNTYYAAALYDSLVGSQLCAEGAEIVAEFNSTFDWDFSTSGIPVPGKMNFMTVVLHEIGHGLGFFGSMRASTETGTFRGSHRNPPDIYDRFAERGDGLALLSTTFDPSSLAAQLVSNNTFFDGPASRAQNGGNRPKLETHHFGTAYGIPFSDNGFLQGSSYSHIDDVLYSPDGSGAPRPNGLMTFQLQSAEVYTDPGPIVRGMFQDMGWRIAAGSPCAYTISPTTYAAPPGGVSASVAINAAAGCAWTAVAQAGFITITGPGSGSGSGNAGFTVSANQSGASRTGSILAAGRTLTITQAPCTYAVSPTTVSLPAAASTASVSVTAPPGCPWSAASQAGFITVTAVSPGHGNGTVTFALPANPRTAVRTGTLAVAGRTISVTQQGVPPAVSGDFDGDRAADLVLFRPANGNWMMRLSANGFASGPDLPFGLPTDKPVPGDYDGDGRIDMAVFRPSNGIWYVIYSSTGALAQLQWGISTDLPMPADFNGDGRTELAVWRPATGVWFIFDLSAGTYSTRQWGISSDVPLTGDFDGDRKADVAVYRRSTGVWWVFFSSTQTYAPLQWGIESDVPLPADYTGDGRTDLAVYRPANGYWFVFDLTTGTYASYQWGIAIDEPAPRDYDGDGRADLAVWRPSTATWFIYYPRTGSFRSVALGAPGDATIR